jgi:uncharacterized protein
MNYYVLYYDVVENFVELRKPYRGEHLRLAQEAYQRGELLLAGALSNPADKAMLLFRTPDSTVAEEFARRDPYVINGLVKRREIRQWNIVIGNELIDGPPERGRK